MEIPNGKCIQNRVCIHSCKGLIPGDVNDVNTHKSISRLSFNFGHFMNKNWSFRCDGLKWHPSELNVCH